MHYAVDKGACVILFYSEISTVKFMESMKSGTIAHFAKSSCVAIVTYYCYHGYQSLDLRSSVCIAGIVKNVNNIASASLILSVI